jgi:hypothetical protein
MTGTRAITALFVGLALASRAAAVETIGVFFDPQGVTCETEQHPVTPGTAYILADLDSGYLASGITGVEFRLDGMPAAWSATAVPRPGATTVGNPLTGGCDIAFVCQTGTNGLVLLYTIHYLVVSDLTVYLQVDRHSTPSNPNFTCPILVGCDAPDGLVLCVRGGTAAINDPLFCRTAVVGRTWTQVKSLFD